MVSAHRVPAPSTVSAKSVRSPAPTRMPCSQGQRHWPRREPPRRCSAAIGPHYTGAAADPGTARGTPCATLDPVIHPVSVSRVAFAPVDEQLAILRRGTATIVVESELRAKLEHSRSQGTPLRVKLGLDPTAPDLHLGHTVVLHKLRDFQDLGHEVIVILGDFTGMIGDPTGRSETRKPLSPDDIRANAATYRAQLGKMLDMDRVRVEFNSSWLAKLTMEDLIRLTAHVTVAQVLQREDFAARYA